GPVDDLVPAHQGPGHAGVPSICRRYEEWVHLWIPFFRWPPAGGSRVPSGASRPEWEHCLPGNAQRVLMRVEADFREVVSHGQRARRQHLTRWLRPGDRHTIGACRDRRGHAAGRVLEDETLRDVHRKVLGRQEITCWIRLSRGHVMGADLHVEYVSQIELAEYRRYLPVLRAGHQGERNTRLSEPFEQLQHAWNGGVAQTFLVLSQPLVNLPVASRLNMREHLAESMVGAMTVNMPGQVAGAERKALGSRDLLPEFPYRVLSIDDNPVHVEQQRLVHFVHLLIGRSARYSSAKANSASRAAG